MSTSQGQVQEPHSDYYKLATFSKAKSINLNLEFLNINSLTEKQREELKKALCIENDDEVNNLSYIITNGQGSPLHFTKSEENIEICKKFLSGIPSVSSFIELNYAINNLSEEAIHILTTNNTKHINHKIVSNYYYANSYYFSPNTFNILINKSVLNQKEDEIIFIFKLKNYDYSGLGMNKDKKYLVLDEETEKIKEVDYENLTPESYLCYTYKITEEEGHEGFTNKLEYFIDPCLNKISNNNKDLPRRYYVTNNTDLAKYYKLNFVENKQKVLFIYINKNGLNKAKEKNKIDYNDLDEDKITMEIVNILKEEVKDDCRYLITHREEITKSLNIIPGDKEILTIRFIDYGHLVYFNEKLDGRFEIINRDDINKNKEKINKNLIYYYKAKYNYDRFNKENIHKFINENLAINKTKTKNKLHPYLESYKYIEEDTSTIPILTADRFKNEIFDKPGKKIIFSTSENCVGCVTTKKILENISDQYNTNNNATNISIYEYDILNESFYFKKINKIPYLSLYDGNKLICQLDVKALLDNIEPKDYNDTLSKYIDEKFKMNKIS